MNDYLKVLAAAFLLSWSLPAEAQDDYDDGQDSPEPTHGLTVITRLDGEIDIPGFKSPGLGNSGLYTELEGDFSENWSYFLCNHWLSDSPMDLYRNAFRADEADFLDFANVTWHNDSWKVILGKDFIPFGTFELAGDDYTAHPLICSAFWNNACVYQWGVKAGWTLPDGRNSFTLGVSSSPHSVRPFADGKMA